MKKFIRLLTAVLAGIVLLWPVSTLARSDDIPEVTSYINDYAGIIDDADRQEMEEMGRQLAADTGSQVIVVTLDDLDGRDAAMLATDIGNNAQAGSGKLDNGVVILVSMNDKQRFMAIGSGLEGVITDIDAEHLQQDYLVPAFRQGDYSQGLKDLYGATVRSIEAGTAAGEIGSDPGYGAGQEDVSFGSILGMFVLPLGLMLVVLALVSRTAKASSTILLTPGEKYQIRLRDVDFLTDRVVVSSSDPQVATVTPDGLITAHQMGTSTIKVDKSDAQSYKFMVKVSRRGRTSSRNDDLLDALFWGSVYSRNHHHSHHHDHWSGGGFSGGGGGFSGGGGGFSGGGSGGSW